MSRQLQSCSKIEVRGTIRFLWAKRLNCTEIHREICSVYGEHTVSRPAIAKWCKQFENGRTDLTDEYRKGRPLTSTDAVQVAAVEQLIRDNRRIKIKEIATSLNISYGSVYSIIHDHLAFRKLCARWVPRLLTSDHKNRRFLSCLALLQRYSAEGNDFLRRIITGDESWFHHFTPEMKRSSMEWMHTNSPVRLKAKVQPSAGKVMATVFFDWEGVVYTEFMPKGTTINAASYCQTLQKLRTAIKQRRRGRLSEGVILLHDNATPHTANQTKQLLQKFKWEVWPHPPYSPDLSPCDYHLFGKIKQELAGQRFRTDIEVKTAVLNWLHNAGREFFSLGMEKLIVRCDKCLQRLGGYVEK